MIVAGQQFPGDICININMADSKVCLGHKEREARQNQIAKLTTRSVMKPAENCKISIKKGPVSVETSLKELEEDYESKPEWKLIKEGGVLSVPVEELRMENLPKPDRSGQVVFKEKKGGQGKQIDNYPVGQTIDKMKELLKEKYVEEKEDLSPKLKKTFAAVTKLPQLQAVKAWQDTNAEIKLKRALDRIMVMFFPSLATPCYCVAQKSYRNILLVVMISTGAS